MGFRRRDKGGSSDVRLQDNFAERGNVDKNVEQILIIYSTAGTPKNELHSVRDAINGFSRPDSTVRTSGLIFEVPAAAAPGSTLGSELTSQLRSSVGAVVFVNDLRPNVAYELGFFHGQGRPVLLVTPGRVDSVWTAISDLAGAALVSLEHQELTIAVHAYLERLYTELGLVAPWPLPELPSKATNLLNSVSTLNGNLQVKVHEGGPFGNFLRIDSWEPTDIPVDLNLTSAASFKVVLRAAVTGSDFSIYFRVLFADRKGIRRRAWLGLSSSRRSVGLEAFERNLPAERATQQWRLLSANFNDLLIRGLVLGAGPVEHLDQIRFRAGTRNSSGSIEIGFVDVIGTSR
jgi:hypothetical protein